MIELHLILRAPPRQTRSLVDALQALAKSARAEPGCTAVRLFMAVGDSRCICYVETWESEEVLRRMIASRHFSQLAALMEMAVEPPECEFRFIVETRGLDFAVQVREGLDPPVSNDPVGSAGLPGQADSRGADSGDSGKDRSV
jgi:quinol monooxygenase YgiN